MIFGFLLAVIYNPWIWNAAIQPRWSLLAVALPILIAIRSPNHFTPLHLAGALFLSWATITLAWSVNCWDGINELSQLAIIGLAFVLGARLQTLKPIFLGLGLGIAVSSLIIVSPLRELVPNQLTSISWEGLFANRNWLAEAAMLAAIGCIGYKLWWVVPGLLPAIFFQPMSRGALLGGLAALGAGIWSKSRIGCAVYLALLCAGLFFAVETDHRLPSVLQRVEIWRATWQGISFWGHGIGSFFTLFPYFTSIDTLLTRPEHAHNDILEIAFELGAIGTILYGAIIALAYRSADVIGRAVLAGFVTIGMFSFPWHIPTTAFIGALVIGHAARNWNSLRYYKLSFRMALRPWHGRKFLGYFANRPSSQGSDIPA